MARGNSGSSLLALSDQYWGMSTIMATLRTVWQSSGTSSVRMQQGEPTCYRTRGLQYLHIHLFSFTELVGFSTYVYIYFHLQNTWASVPTYTFIFIYRTRGLQYLRIHLFSFTEHVGFSTYIYIYFHLQNTWASVPTYTFIFIYRTRGLQYLHIHLFLFKCFVFLRCVQTLFMCNWAADGSFVHPPDGAKTEWCWQEKTEGVRMKRVPGPLCPQHFPHWPILVRTRPFTVKNRWINSVATVRTIYFYTEKLNEIINTNYASYSLLSVYVTTTVRHSKFPISNSTFKVECVLKYTLFMPVECYYPRNPNLPQITLFCSSGLLNTILSVELFHHRSKNLSEKKFYTVCFFLSFFTSWFGSTTCFKTMLSDSSIFSVTYQSLVFHQV
jgi:hypothetical protein